MNPTNEQSAEKSKEDLFLEDYKSLVDKHKMDFVSVPVFIPDGQGGFRLMVRNQIADISNAPVKSPFIAQE